MEPISQANPVLDALRRQVAENVERLRKAGKLATTRPAGQAAAAPAVAETLEAALRRKLAAIDRRSAHGLRAATRTFVETVLVEEFGAEVLADPQFGAMVSDLAAALREEPEIRDQLDRVLPDL
jgi:hypothetical protein